MVVDTVDGRKDKEHSYWKEAFRYQGGAGEGPRHRLHLSFVSMNPMVSDPIHAATAMETATVTAMSMMAAITGLIAFLLFRSFLIFGYFPPYEFTRELDSKEI